MSCCLMDNHIFAFKGFDARSLGPISCLAVPLVSVVPVLLRDGFAATCPLLSVNDGLHGPLKSFSHICETSVSPDLQASRLESVFKHAAHGYNMSPTCQQCVLNVP